MTMIPPTGPLPVPLSKFPYIVGPYSNITPVTMRDGITFIHKVDTLINWVLDNLVPHIDSSVAELIREYNEATAALNAAMLKYQEDIKADQAEFERITKADQAEFQRVVNASLALIQEVSAHVDEKAAEAANSAEEAEMWAAATYRLQDLAVAAITRALDSQTRAALIEVLGIGKERVPVERFYQVDDGDDWAPAINRTIRYATPLGLAVLLSDMYSTESTVVPLSDTRIVGLGPTTGIHAQPSVNIIRGTGVSRVSLDNFMADGGVRTDAEIVKVRGIVFNNSDHITLTNMTVQHCADWATSFEACDYITVLNHTHQAGSGENPGGRDGVHFLDTSDVYMDGATIYSGDDCVGITSEARAINRIHIKNVTGFSRIAAVVTVGNEGPTKWPAQDITMDGISTFVPETEPGRHSTFIIKVRAQNASDLRDLTIRNVAGTSQGHGVWVDGGKGATDVSVANITAVSIDQTGLLLNNIDNLVVSHANVRSLQKLQDGMSVFSCRHALITNVRADESGMNGIQINGGQYITLVGCSSHNSGGKNFAEGAGANLRIVNADNVTVDGGTYVGDATVTFNALSVGGSTNVVVTPSTKFGGKNNTDASQYWPHAPWVDLTYQPGWTGTVKSRMTPDGLQIRGSFRKSDGSAFSGGGEAVGFLPIAPVENVVFLASGTALPLPGYVYAQVGVDRSLAVFGGVLAEAAHTAYVNLTVTVN